MSPTRLLTCVFRKMFSRCFLTVPVLMESSSAMAALSMPDNTQRHTSISRAESRSREQIRFQTSCGRRAHAI